MLCYTVLNILHTYNSMRIYAMLFYANLCYAMLCYALLCYAMLCYAMLCCANLCYALLCYARSEDDVTAQTLNALGEASASLGYMTAARQLFMECYTLRITLLGDKHVDTASVMKNLATVAFAKGAYTEAREMALGALKIYRAHYGPASSTGAQHESIIPVLSDLGEIFQRLGNVTSANGYFDEALRARRAATGQNNTAKLGGLLMNYGKSLCDSAAFPESDRKYAEALELLSDFYQGESNAIVADCLADYSSLKRVMGLFNDAQELAEQCLAMRHELFGEESEPVAGALMILCDLLRQQKDLDAALDAGEECARIRAKLYGIHDSPQVAYSLQMVAKLTLLKGKGEDSLSICRDALGIYDNILNIDETSDDDLSKALGRFGELRSVGISMTTLMHQIASIQNEKGCYVEATALFERCLDLRRRIYGEEHGEVASTLHCIADISFQRGLFEEALEIHSIGHAIRKQCFGEEDVLTAASECYVALSELALGRANVARDRLESCVHRLRMRFGDESLYVAIALHYMGKAFLSLKDYESSVIVEEKALDILLAVEGRDSGYVVDSLSSTGDVYRMQGNAAEAKAQYAKALEILKRLDRQYGGSGGGGGGSAGHMSLSASSRGGQRAHKSLSAAANATARRGGYNALVLEFCKGGEDTLSASGAFDTRERAVARLMGLYERVLWALDSLRSGVEAEAFAEEALDLYAATFGINAPQMVPLLRLLGLRQRGKGDYSGALPFLEKALWIQESSVADWGEDVTDDEAFRRERCLFLNETVVNISDISWLFDKQSMGSDARETQAKSEQYETLLSALRSGMGPGPAPAPGLSLPGAGAGAGWADKRGEPIRSDAKTAALGSFASSERQKERVSEGGGGGAGAAQGGYSLLSNLSLFLSSKSE
jgi:tetratricopeptide (TPR) repeat protein